MHAILKQSWGLTLDWFCTGVEIMEHKNINIAAIFEELNHPSNHVFASY